MGSRIVLLVGAKTERRRLINRGRIEDLDSDKKLRIAIIGCGAVAELAHLPAQAGVAGTEVTLLVDRNRARAESLARQFCVPHVAEDWAATFDYADAAIVALPHSLHGPVSVELLKRGIHILVEKPMAITTAECDSMIEASAQSGATLAVGLMRRFLWTAQFVKRILDERLLGTVLTVDVREGNIYNWPVASDFFFRKKTAGGGVLIDTGAHALDSLLWWLGDVASFEYTDDDYGGVEADCVIDLVLESGVTGVVELSRTRTLRNTTIISGDRASLEIGWGEARLFNKASGLELRGLVHPSASSAGSSQSYLDVWTESLIDWVGAVRNRTEPRVNGVEARRSIAFIEACYARRKPLKLPWLECSRVEKRTPVLESSR